MIPETKYAKSGQVHVAYQIFGEGRIQLVVGPGWASHIEYAWEEPSYAKLLQRLGSFAHVAWFDKRGTGLSDRVAELPTLEQRMDDILAVMDAVGFERAAIFGVSESGSMAALFAATYPERTNALILYGSFAKRIRSEDYPWAPTYEERKKWIDSVEENWGGSARSGHPRTLTGARRAIREMVRHLREAERKPLGSRRSGKDEHTHRYQARTSLDSRPHAGHPQEG